MKPKHLLFILMIGIIISSCSPKTFYQVYKTQPIGDISTGDNSLKYEDENCILIYDFWEYGGNIGFRFYNKTYDDIYVNLDKCFFILNGSSFNYFKHRVYTYSKGTGVSSISSGTASVAVTGLNTYNLIQTNQLAATSTAELMASRGYSVSYAEEMIVCIPAKTSKLISEYLINNTLIRDCDLYKYPKNKQINTLIFTRDNSPLVFSNRITYTVGDSEENIDFENEFFVAEITNYPEDEILESKYGEFCGQKSMLKDEYFKDAAPDKFYIEYNKGNDPWKH
ncbi:MAG: hypothetical protein RQ761_10785 [Bacteroidales bacterium]|nr:hypothetical protein [Bacteroidales bacterium]